jgi:hypothetical protein
MTDSGRTTYGLPHPAHAASPWNFFAHLDSWVETRLTEFMQFMTRCLCRASRGYLCPPDMTSVMYPDDPGSQAVQDSVTQSDSRKTECCQ